MQMHRPRSLTVISPTLGQDRMLPEGNKFIISALRRHQVAYNGRLFFPFSFLQCYTVCLSRHKVDSVGWRTSLNKSFHNVIHVEEMNSRQHIPLFGICFTLFSFQLRANVHKGLHKVPWGERNNSRRIPCLNVTKTLCHHGQHEWIRMFWGFRACLTCGRGQLQWGLGIVLRSVLQGPFHTGSCIQQQLPSLGST